MYMYVYRYIYEYIITYYYLVCIIILFLIIQFDDSIQCDNHSLRQDARAPHLGANVNACR